MKEPIVRDRTLSPSGQLKIDWAAAHMPVLSGIVAEYRDRKPLSGHRVAMSIHLEAKTALLALSLRELGAQVYLTGSNPLSTQDDVAAAALKAGVTVYALHQATDSEYSEHINCVLDSEPDLLLDDGGDLVGEIISSRQQLAKGVIGGCEETTTGVNRLRALMRSGDLPFPMIAVNDAKTKYLFDNRYGTGQSVWDGIMRSTNLVVAGKTVVVVGYGWCGKGIALRADGLGARVVVCEVDPIRANEALMDGYAVMPICEAAGIADFVVTATGCTKAVSAKALGGMKDGAILANAGHFDVEIDKVALVAEATSVRKVREGVEEFCRRDGRRLYLIAEGRLVNLAAADGHPVEIMDMSFAVQALCLIHLAEFGTGMSPGVHEVPSEVDEAVARARLKALGVSIDELTFEQKEYLNSWRSN